ncbi:MAG TPA: IPT/TIG domain-containing protein [Pyrinomonadaceae bacterium]
MVVTNGAGKTVTLSYTYTAAASGPPGGGATLKIDPPSGPAADSTPVAITGTGFSDVDAVLFGDNPSEPPATLSADKTTVNATAPPNPEGGEVTVTVKNKAGDARTLKYEYKN